MCMSVCECVCTHTRVIVCSTLSVYIGQWALRTGRPGLCWLAWAPVSGTGHSAPHLGLLTSRQLPLGTDCRLWPSFSIFPLQKPVDPPQPRCSCIEPRAGSEPPRLLTGEVAGAQVLAPAVMGQGREVVSGWLSRLCNCTHVGLLWLP